uniref:G-protein coupled receptors family 1 profile domain-containing protein n=1 Tax=Plectus sambesii TaxID=2011161 RepID=A0A914VGK0_9BILA
MINSTNMNVASVAVFNITTEKSALITATNVALLVLGVLSIVGNGFLLLVIARYQKLRNNLCTLLIGILAIADLGSGIGLLDRGLVELIWEMNGYYNYNKGECLALGFMSLFSVHMGQFITAFIAFDRLDAVRDPFGYATKNKLKRAQIALVVTVSYSLFGMGIAFIGVDFSEHPDTCATGSCVLNLYAMYWVTFAMGVAIAIVYAYVKTTLILRRKMHASSTSVVEKRELSRQVAVFKTIRLVLFVYAVSWCLPNFQLIIVTVMNSATGIGYISSLIAVGTGINSSVNVLIYACKHREIGGHMRKFFCSYNNGVMTLHNSQARRSTTVTMPARPSLKTDNPRQNDIPSKT